MAVTLYLEGRLSSDGDCIELPLSSCALLLVTNYAGPSSFHLVFVKPDKLNLEASSKYVSISKTGLASTGYEFTNTASLPELITNVVLPAVLDSAANMVRSGLCVIIRHVIKVAHSAAPDQGLIDLLGFRQGSLRMCAEVSGWTKLCEVELPNSVTQLVHNVKAHSGQKKDDAAVVELPADLLKLEAHYEKPPKIHNDDRQRRQELSRLKADFSDAENHTDVLQSVRVDGSHLVLERKTELSHGWRKICVRKEINGVCKGADETAGMAGLSLQDESRIGMSREQMNTVVQKLTYLDIKLVHLYSEGVEMTIADFCLFSYLYFLLEALQFDLCGLEDHFPRILTWLRHMVTLPRLESASTLCGFEFEKLKTALLADGAKQGERRVRFTKPSMQEITEDDMELSRRCRTKHKALKPEVIDALSKMKDCGIEPTVGLHPCGTNVSLKWDTFPDCVNPKEGKVPAKRVERKCQQLENLVTAVQEVARPGNTIVDFCSGGGHLGIAIAHVLPQCKIYLVENKEESLAKAQSRMAQMNSKNIVLYQCNMDYFVGTFDVGVCLHACGSATDMVLHQCLSNHAAFVICPCCYGGIQRTHLLDYPRSRMYQDKNVSYTEFLTLGHAADQTEFNIALEQQGRQCMNLVDSDRAELAREAGYSVTLTSLQPLTCSPKNNLLIGQKHCVASS
ncbi:glutathione S-transferase C-terminal domain-containing protein-like isoform X2 [Littorina saxatilis]|uniref:GST C-terminal domain-containing protein n=2 Tax=Littorina saxatilis TaxID=31220 RepID=A0AAN9B1L1_9CAEN